MFTIYSAASEPLVSCWDLSTAEQLAEQAGAGAIVRVVLDDGDSWPLWVEGDEYPDKYDYAYHMYLVMMKRHRRARFVEST